MLAATMSGQVSEPCTKLPIIDEYAALTSTRSTPNVLHRVCRWDLTIPNLKWFLHSRFSFLLQNFFLPSNFRSSTASFAQCQVLQSLRIW